MMATLTDIDLKRRGIRDGGTADGKSFDHIGKRHSEGRKNELALNIGPSIFALTHFCRNGGRKRQEKPIIAALPEAASRRMKVSQILDPDSAGQLTVATNYSYDALGRLTTITQGAQTRSFTYDAMGRLKSETHPESGTATYSHDANSNVHVRTEARGISTTYAYDDLNRVVSYVRNDPVNLVDPDGQDWRWAWLDDGFGTYVWILPNETIQVNATVPPIPMESVEIITILLLSHPTYENPHEPADSGGGNINPAEPCGQDGFRPPTAADGLDIAAQAYTYIDVKRRDGAGAGSSRATGVDCSGLVACVMRDMGIPYAYTPARQIPTNPSVKQVPADDVRPGDIAVFRGHVGVVNIVDSESRFTVIHPSSGKAKVVEGEAQYIMRDQPLVGFYRPKRVPCKK